MAGLTGGSPRNEAAFDIVRCEQLGDVPHGFFGSAGGVHHFGYSGLGDPAPVAAWRAGAARAIDPAAVPVTPTQTHSADVLTVERPWPDTPDGRPGGDALVTAVPGLAIGVVTADCAPVLFADSASGVVGAAHAGWRGAAGNIVEHTIAAMEAIGAGRDRIVAAIGPAIAQGSYEVDEAFRAHFGAADDRHFRNAEPREGKARWHFDLPGYVAARLGNAQIAAIGIIPHDTYASPHRYHSYRRTIGEGSSYYRNQISMIAVPHKT